MISTNKGTDANLRIKDQMDTHTNASQASRMETPAWEGPRMNPNPMRCERLAAPRRPGTWASTSPTGMVILCVMTVSGCHLSKLGGRSDAKHVTRWGTASGGEGDNQAPRVTVSEKVPETVANSVAPAQRLATNGQTSRSPDATQVASETNADSAAPSSEIQQVAYEARLESQSKDTQDDSPKAATEPSANGTRHTAAVQGDLHDRVRKAGLEGVDLSSLMEALGDQPPQVQEMAIRRLLAVSQARAEKSGQPKAINEVLAASLDSLPQLPDTIVDNGLKTQRLAASQPQTSPQPTQTDAVVSPSSLTGNAVQPTQPDTNALSDAVATRTAMETKTQPLTGTPAVPPAIATKANETFSLSDQDQVALAVMQQPIVTEETTGAIANDITQTSGRVNAPGPGIVSADSLTDADLFDALLQRLQTAADNESEAERHRRMIMARHVMVLAGKPDLAANELEGLTAEEQEYLRHQLTGLWNIVDPKGHPVVSRRMTKALPSIRRAAQHLAEAADSLEVRSLEFCTEIEAYGQIKPFPDRGFQPGQQVILYCEIENFRAEMVDSRYQTALQGSYDILDASGSRIASQTLPEDRQTANHYLRDYFIAYQMYLPEEIGPGKYRLRLTMEDLNGKKYGQSEIPFEIKR
ncbi:MAG: hypothetical protein AAGD07_08010 [Planctomycetota bacterium]